MQTQTVHEALQTVPYGRESACATLNIAEAAQRIGIGRNSAYSLARSGRLPGLLRIGGRYLVSRVALERWLAGAE